jgi:hypothetical protein
MKILLGGIVAALAASAALASAASASPSWKLNGTPLGGPETVTGSAVSSSLTLPGLTTTCDYSYKMTISNNLGTGEGKITELPIVKCSTNSKACTVAAAAAEGLPWSVHAKTIGTGNYIIVEGVKIGILYAGEECVLNETLLRYKGSAGALFNNANSTFTFSPANFTATGTELKALGASVQWNGVFSTNAPGGVLTLS